MVKVIEIEDFICNLKEHLHSLKHLDGVDTLIDILDKKEDKEVLNEEDNF